MCFTTASRVYQPRNLIYTEKPFAHVLPEIKRNYHCEFCFKETENLIACTVCSVIKYCGIKCQANDSRDHGIECENLEKIIGNPYEDFIRLLGRIIFKIKDKDWKTITRNVMGTDVSFEDLDAYYEEMTKNAKCMLMYKGMKTSLKEFVGEENLPEEENLLKIIGKVKFSGEDFGLNLPCEFYFGMSKFQHECVPNSNLDVYRNVMKVWAIKKISVSEKITVSFNKVISADIMRTPINEDSLNICQCTECSLPYGESILTKILDEEKAYEVILFSERLIRMGNILSKFQLEEDVSFRILVDLALQMQEGVLAHTNALHLKLLATKMMTLSDSDRQKKMHLIELEKDMRAAFGKYYIELCAIYEGLVDLSLNSCNVVRSIYYSQKLKPFMMHR